MKRTLTSLIAVVAFCAIQLPAIAQETKANIDESQRLGQATKSAICEVEMVGTRNTPSADLDWVPFLTSKVKKVEHSLPGKAELMAMKAEKWELKTNYSAVIGDDEEDVEDLPQATPVVGNEFLGNPNNGSSPMDNSVAISDGGIIISVANTTIEYNTMSGTTTYSNSILDFIDDASISYVCDPVVLYDAPADRFIFFAQECSGSSSNSQLLILFSQTNDPADGWNYYKITGNPNDESSWFDYPKLAISQNELFITGNLFTDGGSFDEPVVYQMEKTDGYTGGSLTWQYWNNIPGSPATLLVVSSGNENNYGPGIYVVSTSSFSGSTIKFYDITDNIAGSPEMNYYSVSTPSYEVAANSQQLGTSCQLDNGDCRCLSGFYLNGVIHFVFQSDAGSGWNGINYNRLDVATLSNESNVLDNAGTRDYSYPSVSWFGFGPSDKSVMIGFGSASSAVYPEIRAVHCNDAGDWSETTLVKESNSYASFTSTTVERWGDYTGTARNHDAAEPSVWMNGMYGTGTHRWNTWIAEIHANYTSGLVDESKEEKMVIAPNPVFETFNISFEIDEDIPVVIEIIGMDGRVVKRLYEGTAHTGTNQFVFNKANLASGTYFLQIVSNDNKIANEKIIIQ